MAIVSCWGFSVSALRVAFSASLEGSRGDPFKDSLGASLLPFAAALSAAASDDFRTSLALFSVATAVTATRLVAAAATSALAVSFSWTTFYRLSIAAFLLIVAILWFSVCVTLSRRPDCSVFVCASAQDSPPCLLARDAAR